ncbi:MAG: GntR family transcriptional regulator [Heliobacteriaceae bacterium]|nr:GntR family transcriptional regulator [Heliobacteriaceae bacterium]MDD4588453.1 GntR family transcriptional regulator [Heliobacteriaceae bacterium]
MFQLDYRDRRPLYEQIKEKIKALIIRGVLKPDDRLPSVREMAQSLTINPNTIQKSYKDLETEGFIYSVRAKGNFVQALSPAMNQARREELVLELEKLAAEFVYLSVPVEQLVAVIHAVYKKKEG